MLEVLLIFLVLLVVLLIAYKGAVHEFQILQKDWNLDISWSNLLSEQLPVVVRNVDPSWQGSWTRRSTQKKPWPIHVRREEDGALMKGKWNEWLASPPGQPDIASMLDIEEVIQPPLALWTDHGFRRWNWLPVGRASLRVLGPTPTSVTPVRKTTAAATLLQSTDGAPAVVWLAHEGAVPASVQMVGLDPWRSDDVPWMNEVKFIEVKLRPGNALVIPTHWYYAVRPLLPVVTDTPKMADGSWFWTAEFHTPISWLVTAVRS